MLVLSLFWGARNHGHIAIRYVCVSWLFHWPAHLSPETPESLRHSNIKIRPINNITSTCPINRKNHASLTLNPKIEMVKLLKKARQSQNGQKLGLFPLIVKLWSKGNVLKGNQKCSSSEHTKEKIAKQPYWWYGESFSGLEERSQHCLRPKPNPEQGPSSLQVYEGWRRWGSYRKKSWKPEEVGSWVLRKEAIFRT